MQTRLKFITLFLLVSTLLWIASTDVPAIPNIAEDQIFDSSGGLSLNERILRVENGLSPQSDEDEPSSSTFSLVDRMDFYKTLGVSVAVINNGEIEWARGYGVREAGGNDAVDPETLFQAASISKPVTAMAVLKLVQEGVLNLDEDVNEKLISWKVPDSRFTRNQQVTLRNLLSHSAGMTVHGFDGYRLGKKIPTTLQILTGERPANSNAVRVDSEINQRFEYSGGGYVVIQQLLSDVTRKPFSDFMQETVLDRLGMTNSTYQQPLPESKRALAAAGHQIDLKLVPTSC